MVKNKRAAKDLGDAPALGFVGSLRWIWTQLTSMPTALFLLLLLAVAAVPGSIFPQRSASAENVAAYLELHPIAGPWLDRFQLFEVYSSFWFSAIYLLLFISLVGCIIPRVKKHAKALRTPPPRTPARLERLPEYTRLEILEGEPDTPSDDELIAQSHKILKKRGYRVEHREDASGRSVAAERGYTREIGNLAFHISLIGVLASVAFGGAFGYNGQRVLVEGETFVNSLVAYDSFSPGTNFNPDQLAGFSVTLNKFDITFERDNSDYFGQPIDFTANVSVKDSADAAPKDDKIKVNSPLRVDGADVYLVGNGYAPVITVRDGEGNISYSGPVVSVAQDSVYTSLLVLKVPDAEPEQLGFQGFLLPTSLIGEDGVAFSGDPNAINPQLQMNSFYGDLGLDEGTPQNVYVLDSAKMTELNNRNLDAGGIVLGAGESYTLPDGLGTITFDDLKRYVALDIHHDPSKKFVAAFAGLALLGLIVSLFTPRRRVWVKLRTDEGKRSIEYALLARGEDPRLQREAAELHKIFDKAWPLASQEQEEELRELNAAHE